MIKSTQRTNDQETTLPTKNVDNTQGSMKIDLKTSSKYGRKTENT